MSKEIITRCGYRCDLCLAYKDHIEKNDQRAFLSDTWHKIFGFRILPENIYCEGCLSTKLDAQLIDSGCPIRPCVIEKGLENCGQCSSYACDKFNQRVVVYDDLVRNTSAKITKKEYTGGIKPYENQLRLAALKTQCGEYMRLINPAIIPTRTNIPAFIEDEKAV